MMTIEGKKTLFLCLKDSGSQFSAIESKIIHRYGLTKDIRLPKDGEPMTLGMANGSEIPRKGQITLDVCIRFLGLNKQEARFTKDWEVMDMKGHSVIIGVDLSPILFPKNKMTTFFIPTSSITGAPQMHLIEPAEGTPHNLPSVHLEESKTETEDKGQVSFVFVEDEEEEDNNGMEIVDESNLVHEEKNENENKNENRKEERSHEDAVREMNGGVPGPTYLLDRKKLEAFLIKEMSSSLTQGGAVKISRAFVPNAASRKQQFRSSH